MAKAPNKFSAGLRKKKTDKASAAPAPSAARPRARHRKLGQVLVDVGFITDDQLWQLVEHHKMSGMQIGKAAIDLQMIDDRMLLQALAEQQGMSTFDMLDDEFMVPGDALGLIDENMCTLYKILPVKYEEGVLSVAMADPSNIMALDDLRNLLPVNDVIGMAAEEDLVMEAISRNYSAVGGSSIDDLVAQMAVDESLRPDAGQTGSIDLDSLEEMAEAAPVRKLLNMVMLMAIRDKASDIHLEPFEGEFRMRYRADGVMHELTPPPRHLAPAIASRVKVMANLDIAERRLPQDGRIELSLGGNPIDLRVSVLPTMFGEGIVMRILDRTVVNLDLEKVGMPEKTLVPFRKLIESPNGIVLVTGPTGSGKTTTLYSALTELNKITEKIITTEDPIEYDIDGIIQVPINPDIDVTFANALRAILRQDPDIILVGEIRDFETAQIAIQSSLTGHLVFSTLHTNDAAGAVTRLRDMGVPAFLISATVEGVLAQRLVRRICTKCREEFSPTPEMLMELNLLPEKVRDRKFYRGAGCEFCTNSGYKGRQGVFELLVCDDHIREMINKGATKDELIKAAKQNGMTTLREAGLRAIFEGHTTIDEVARETILDEDIQ
ncbi:Type II/IV secretion system protein [Planctomycetes bacterium Pan216]|uniref:Type II/IV secretion system protein n=1 Tax=Kolteria novifilia TaxID=2527975 RepID=A0A518AZY8_9BACT|nr:Type II/IV secretion system protein [Planctomycetes bacterium Pan216]